MQESKQPQLDYAPAKPATRRIIRRWGVWMLLLITIASAVAITPKLFRHWQMLSLQRLCLNYCAPLNQIVFDTRSVSLPALHRSDPVFVQESTAGPSGTSFVGRVPTEWRAFSALISPPGVSSYGTAFLHRRRSPAGHERLVAIDVEKGDFIFHPNWHARVIAIGSKTTMPYEIASNVPFAQIEVRADYGIIGTPATWVVVAGQPDATQLDHFTIEVHGSIGSSIIHGYLRDDDQIVMEWPR